MGPLVARRIRRGPPLRFLPLHDRAGLGTPFPGLRSDTPSDPARVDEIVVRQSSSSLRYGLLLGLLAAAQYYISDEVLALTGIVAVIGVLLLAVTHWREALRRARHVIEAFAYAAVACGILVAYPVWYTYFGPAHINGPPQSLASLATFPGDLVAGIAPTVSQLFGSAHLKSIGDHLTGGDVTENGMYLGIPLIVALGLIVGFCRRVRTVVFFAVMLLVSYVLALDRGFTSTSTTPASRCRMRSHPLARDPEPSSGQVLSFRPALRRSDPGDRARSLLPLAAGELSLAARQRPREGAPPTLVGRDAHR